MCGRFTELYYSSSGLPPHTLQPAVPAANEGPSELHIALNEWDYVPNVGSRPSGGYVVLKNAGATCYMNSVLQQVCATFHSHDHTCLCLLAQTNKRTFCYKLVIQYFPIFEAYFYVFDLATLVLSVLYSYSTTCLQYNLLCCISEETYFITLC